MRALVHPALDEAVKNRLREMIPSAGSRRAVGWRCTKPRLNSANALTSVLELSLQPSPERTATAILVRSFGEDWKRGEERAIHRRPYVRRKPITCRPSMLDFYVPLIEEWLATAPHLSAVDILGRPGEHVPDRLGNRQLRTVQRLVKKWRAKAAHQLINSAEVTIRIEPPPVTALAMPASGPAQLDAGMTGQ